MGRGSKSRKVKLMVIGWLVLAGCKFPEFLSGMGEAIGNVFNSIARGFGF